MAKTLQKILFAFFLLLASQQQTVAQDSSRIRVSLLTCTPGEELYSIFGHSAIRIIDSNNVTDYVYNYGTFNFDDEGFYLKFVRGKLLYYVSLERADDFIYNYMASGRGITEQLLNLSAEEKITVQKALNENLKEENKYYKYDFFLDNCTTRLRDIITNNKNPKPVLPAVMPVNTRFRQAIHAYLDKGGQYWSKLGIDILLGAPTDKIMTAAEQEFLPDNLMSALDSSKNVKVIASKTNLYEIGGQKNDDNLFTPMLCFSLLFLMIFLIGLSKSKFSTIFLIGFDHFFFFVIGLLGILLILMWVATDHTMTKNNFNLIWALPTHTLASFFITSNKNYSKRYFDFTMILMIAILISWLFLPQEMNNSLLPIVLLIFYRSYARHNKK